MHERVIERLLERMRTYEDLVAALPGPALAASLPVPSNAIGGPFWCVVGARESYARAIVAGEWAGFSCSLTSEAATRIEGVRDALVSSAEAVRDALDGVGWTTGREGLLLDLLEHEAQHQGQLIRYVYGLGLSFPQSWKDRWALSRGGAPRIPG